MYVCMYIQRASTISLAHFALSTKYSQLLLYKNKKYKRSVVVNTKRKSIKLLTVKKVKEMWI